MSASDGQASAEPQGSPALAALPPELLRRVSGLLEPDDTLAAAQTCHSWCAAVAPEEEPAGAEGPGIDCLPQQLLGHILGMAVERQRDCGPLALVCKRWHAAVWAEPSMWRQLRLAVPEYPDWSSCTDEVLAARYSDWMQGALHTLRCAGGMVWQLELNNMGDVELPPPAQHPFFAAAVQCLPALSSLSLLAHTRASLGYLLPCTGLTSLNVEGHSCRYQEWSECEGPPAAAQLQLSQLTALSRLKQLRIKDMYYKPWLPPHPSAFPALATFEFSNPRSGGGRVEVCGATLSHCGYGVFRGSHTLTPPSATLAPDQRALMCALRPFGRSPSGITAPKTLVLSVLDLPDLRALLSALQPPGQALCRLHLDGVLASLGGLYGCNMLSALTSLEMSGLENRTATGHSERLDALLDAVLQQAPVAELTLAWLQCTRFPPCLARLACAMLRKVVVVSWGPLPELPSGPYLQGLQHLRLLERCNSRERFKVLPLALTAARCLTQLDLSDNLGFEPSAAAMDPVLTRLPHLIHLDLSGCYVKELPSAEYLTALSGLDLSGSYLWSMLPPALTAATNLRRLSLRGLHTCEIMCLHPSDPEREAEEAAAALASLPLLEDLDLTSNTWAGAVADRLRLVRPQLRVLV